MFCPPGYFHWNDLCSFSRYWSEGILRARFIASRGGDPSRAFDNENPAPQAFIDSLEGFGDEKRPNFDKFREARFVQSMFETWLIANFVSLYPTYICSPKSQLLKIDSSLCLHADRLDWCYWTWPAQENPHFRFYFEKFREGKFTEVDLDFRFCCIDARTGLISIKNNTAETLNRALHTSDSLEQTQTLVKKAVKPFVGWSLCWSEAEAPKSLEELFDDLGIMEREWRSAVVPHDTRSRPKSKGGTKVTLQCVLQAYPDGKGAATWEEVESRVGYSRRHIMRAINANPDHLDWAKGGQNPQ